MRVFNFSAGPAVLPEEVLMQAAAEMFDWHGSGMSVMEMSHRGKEFIGIAAKAEADLRTLLAIPADYKVLFLQGGAIAENAIVPMNLVGERKVADYVHTGEWSKKSIKEAKKYCTVNIAASAEDEILPTPAQSTRTRRCRARTSARTTIEASSIMDNVRNVLPSLISSHILSRVWTSKYGVIYGGAQRTRARRVHAAIIRGDLLDRALPITLGVSLEGAAKLIGQYAAHVRDLHRGPRSRVVGARRARDREEAMRKPRSSMIIWTRRTYRSPARKADRSRMNVIPPARREKPTRPSRKARRRRVDQLKGRRVGAVCASIYNACRSKAADAPRLHEAIRSTASLPMTKYQILTLNQISSFGPPLPGTHYVVGKAVAEPDAILVRCTTCTR
jgi:phosphoserine aminotransferase